MPSRKDVQDVRKLVEKRGFKVVPSGSGHWKVLNSKGQVMTDDDGPIIMSGTSGEIRGRDMAVKRMMNAGILPEDPWKPTSPKEPGAAPTRDEQEEARRERELELQRHEDHERSERTHRIRERLEPIIARLGGWDKRGVKANLGQVASYYAGRMELPERWSSATAAAENAESIRLGATLSPSMASLWEHLLSELEAYPDTQVRFFQLEREAKGIAEPTIGDPDGFSRSGYSRAAETPALLVQAELPTLALRAMFEMGVGRPAHDPDRPHILKLGEEILRLEMKERNDDSKS